MTYKILLFLILLLNLHNAYTSIQPVLSKDMLADLHPFIKYDSNFQGIVYPSIKTRWKHDHVDVTSSLPLNLEVFRILSKDERSRLKRQVAATTLAANVAAPATSAATAAAAGASTPANNSVTYVYKPAPEGGWDMAFDTRGMQIPEPTRRPRGQICTTELFRRLDNCCPTPAFISMSDINRCVQRSPERYRRAIAVPAPPSRKAEFYRRLHVIVYNAGGTGSGRGNVRGGGNNRGRVIPKQARQGNRRAVNGTIMVSNDDGGGMGSVGGVRQQGRTNIRQVCLVDCVFRNLKWVSDDWTINANMMFSTMAALAPPSWAPMINMARAECSPLIARGATATMTHSSGYLCLVAPTKLMRCVKRTLILNCPSILNSGPQCMDDMSLLQMCDINTI